jgi:hypothetical protein
MSNLVANRHETLFKEAANFFDTAWGNQTAFARLWIPSERR